MTGIDGDVELEFELERLAGESALAAELVHAPKQLYRALRPLLEREDPEATALVQTLVLRLGIWWSPSLYAVMPVMTPWCVRDRSCRYDQGPEAWGSPRADGYLRDDNSIIKKLPLPVPVSAPHGHPYAGRKPWRGFTACHVWRELPDGGIGGEDPWLYSFVPNLVWLPRPLAPLTDIHGSGTQRLLQRISKALYASHPVQPEVAQLAHASWGRLATDHSGDGAPDMTGSAFFDPDGKFVDRRLKYLDKFVAACDEVLDGKKTIRRVVCTRYTVGLPDVDPRHVSELRSALATYRAAVTSAASATTGPLSRSR